MKFVRIKEKSHVFWVLRKQLGMSRDIARLILPKVDFFLDFNDYWLCASNSCPRVLQPSALGYFKWVPVCSGCQKLCTSLFSCRICRRPLVLLELWWWEWVCVNHGVDTSCRKHDTSAVNFDINCSSQPFITHSGVLVKCQIQHH